MVTRNLAKRMSSSALTMAVLALAFASLASAQATRTWVSGVGDDANPCSRTAPCKTFAGAISKTSAGGEIDALDPGGFGAVTITKSITLDGGGGMNSSILASATNAIVINAGTGIVVIRNLSINGAGTTLGLDGVKIIAAGTVHLEHDVIFNFSTDGVEVAAGAAVNLDVDDCVITDIGQAGVSVTTTVGSAVAELNNVRIYDAHPGVRAGANSIVTIGNSDLSFNAAAVKQIGASSVAVAGTQLNNNGTALLGVAGATMRASHNTMGQNTTAVNPNGGTISSDGTNVGLGNTADGAFNGGAISPF